MVGTSRVQPVRTASPRRQPKDDIQQEPRPTFAPARCYTDKMLRLLKTLLLSLLMLALPVQGVAAATGTSCGPAHRHGMLSSLQLPEHEAHGHQHFADEHHDAAAKAQPGGLHGDLHIHHPADPSDSDHHASASSCSACAACCVGAVLPPSALNHQPLDRGALALLVASVTPLPGFIPEGPKRPPRTLPV